MFETEYKKPSKNGLIRNGEGAKTFIFNSKSMKDTNYDWSRFTKRVTIATDLAGIYKSWVTRSGLESWFLSKAEYKDADGVIRDDNEEVQVGDRYSWEWVAANDVVEGEVLDKEEGRSITYSFLGCRVKVSVYSEKGESISEVVQSEIPLDEASKVGLHLECTEGWTFYMTNQKSVLEGGKDLRNRNEAIGNIINT